MSGGAEGAAPKARKVYVSHPPETWERARRRYLEGATAGKVAAELDVSISAVRLRASRGGWTRRDARSSVEAPEEAAPPPSARRESVALGEGRFDPPLSPSARGGGPPTHLRLTPGAWEVIRGERLAGMTVADLAQKWEVSEGTIRRHAAAEGWTNTDRGEAVSQAMVEEAIAARSFAEGRAAAQLEAAQAVAAREGAPCEAPEADPLEAAQVLLRRAAGAAMAGRVGEASEGVKLAEALARAAERLGAAGGGGGPGKVEYELGEDDDAWRFMTEEEVERLRQHVISRMDRFDPDPGPDTDQPPAPERSMLAYTRATAGALLQRIARARAEEGEDEA